MTPGLFARSALISFVVLSLPATAAAHFHLDAPDSWAEQDASGSPQKAGPCGETDSASGGSTAKPTNKVTAYKPGDTVVVKLTETVTHPGYYRVALAKSDRSELPPDPDVTPGGTPVTDCGTAKIESTPTFPVLVDGALQHTSKFNGQQTIMVKLPTNVTCTNCTLQIIEFMSAHGKNNPGGCFYHHCANISIQGDATGTGGASGQGGASAGGNTSIAGASAGGATGVGGGANGGTTSVAGASSSGGTSVGGTNQALGGTLGASGAAAVPFGGAVGAGGSTSSGGGASLAGTSAHETDSSDDGGCAFEGGSGRRSSAVVSAVFFGLALGLRRRRAG